MRLISQFSMWCHKTGVIECGVTQCGVLSNFSKFHMKRDVQEISGVTQCWKAFLLIRLDDLFVAPQDVVDADLAERMSAMKRPGESDMDFYERRYQERVSFNISHHAFCSPTRIIITQSPDSLLLNL